MRGNTTIPASEHRLISVTKSIPYPHTVKRTIGKLCYERERMSYNVTFPSGYTQ